MVVLSACVAALSFGVIGLSLTNLILFNLFDGMRDEVRELKEEMKKNGL